MAQRHRPRSIDARARESEKVIDRGAREGLEAGRRATNEGQSRGEGQVVAQRPFRSRLVRLGLDDVDQAVSIEVGGVDAGGALRGDGPLIFFRSIRMALNTRAMCRRTTPLSQ